jgi:hypothetical protein
VSAKREDEKGGEHEPAEEKPKSESKKKRKDSEKDVEDMPSKAAAAPK